MADLPTMLENALQAEQHIANQIDALTRALLQTQGRITLLRELLETTSNDNPPADPALPAAE